MFWAAQLVYHRGATARLGQPNTLVEFAALKSLCRLVLHLAGPAETVMLAPEWSKLTKLTELSLEGMHAMPRGTGVLEVRLCQAGGPVKPKDGRMCALFKESMLCNYMIAKRFLFQ